jgi:hypothetical protein
MLDRDLKVDNYNRSCGIGLTELLYTARGSQGAATDKQTTTTLGLDKSTFTDSYSLQIEGKTHSMYFTQRPLFTLQKTPQWAPSRRTFLVSLPLFSFLSSHGAG